MYSEMMTKITEIIAYPNQIYNNNIIYSMSSGNTKNKNYLYTTFY